MLPQSWEECKLGTNRGCTQLPLGRSWTMWGSDYHSRALLSSENRAICWSKRGPLDILPEL
jgi:hypothetical protein